MPKLTDLQSLLLAHAAKHADGALKPLPADVATAPARVMRAIAQLLRHGLLEERTVREDEAPVPYITSAGLAAIGIEPDGAAEAAGEPNVATETVDEELPDAAAPAARQTKMTLVLDLLARDGGATLPELVTATGWLPHTTRAALTGLRKKGHVLVRTRRDDAPCYSLAGGDAR